MNSGQVVVTCWHLAGIPHLIHVAEKCNVVSYAPMHHHVIGPHASPHHTPLAYITTSYVLMHHHVIRPYASQGALVSAYSHAVQGDAPAPRTSVMLGP